MGKELAMPENSKKKSVYFAGVFDIFHAGHLNAIEAAKQHGNFLIVGVLNDEAVKRYKGICPIIPFEQRARVISSLKAVDLVVEQDDTDPTRTFERLLELTKGKFQCPDVLVRGDDYNGVPPGTEYMFKHGKKVKRTSYTKGISTSQIKTKIIEEKKNMTHHEQLIVLLRSFFGWKEIQGIEIGTSNGDSAKAMLSAVKNITKLYTIDAWAHVDGAEFEASFPQERLNESKRIAHKLLETFIENGRCEIIHAASDDAVIYFNDEQFDFVWIDGHHSYDQVMKDVLQYNKFVKKGGICGGHDYGQVPDVAKAVDEIFGKENVNTGGDFTWWVVMK